MNYIIQLYILMDQLWAAVEEYYILPVGKNGPDELTESISLDAYSRELTKVLNDIQMAHIALDEAHIDIQNQRQTIQLALRRARNAAKKFSDNDDVRSIFASVFRTHAPDLARLFNVLLQRKRLSRISITVTFDDPVIRRAQIVV